MILRRDYTLAKLSEKDLDPNPLIQLAQYFQEAIDLKLLLPDAMTLATVTAQGTPDARIVLLKELNESGLIFYTNYESPTGRQLESCPHASIVLWWAELERQVRVRGHVEKVSAEKSDAYFMTRPRATQIGAWSSAQSEVIASRDVLEENFKKVEQKFQNSEVPRPRHWGGYILIPSVIEFWQGGANRLHDRIRFRRNQDKTWIMERLSP